MSLYAKNAGRRKSKAFPLFPWLILGEGEGKTLIDSGVKTKPISGI
jgi:hypothetical protein